MVWAKVVTHTLQSQRELMNRAIGAMLNICDVLVRMVRPPDRLV